MHFQIVKDKYYSNIIDDLYYNVPEFKSNSEFDKDDGIYIVIGEFGDFLSENIHKNEIAKKSFRFLNNAIDEGKDKTEDVIVLQVFQKLYESKQSVEISKKYLKNKALIIFLKYFEEHKKYHNISD